MQRLFVMRHGETDWNVEGRLQGVRDIPLNAKGLQQATDGARLFRESFTEVFSVAASPLERAKVTAGSFGQAVHIWPSLLERDFGTFEGLGLSAIQELAERDKDPLHDWYRERGIETLHEMEERAHASVHFVKKAGGHWLLVSHGRFIRALLGLFEGVEARGLRNTEWVELPLSAYRVRGLRRKA